MYNIANFLNANNNENEWKTNIPKRFGIFCKSPATIFELDTNLIYISFLRSLHNIYVF